MYIQRVINTHRKALRTTLKTLTNILRRVSKPFPPPSPGRVGRSRQTGSSGVKVKSKTQRETWRELKVKQRVRRSQSICRRNDASGESRTIGGKCGRTIVLRGSFVVNEAPKHFCSDRVSRDEILCLKETCDGDNPTCLLRSLHVCIWRRRRLSLDLKIFTGS